MPARLTRPSGRLDAHHAAGARRRHDRPVRLGADGQRREARPTARRPSRSWTPRGCGRARTGSPSGRRRSTSRCEDRVDRKLAHSDRFALARMIAPAARSWPTMNASGGRAGSSAADPAVAGRPATWTLSLTRTGIPSSGPRGLPARQAASLAAACSRASGVTAITAPQGGIEPRDAVQVMLGDRGRRDPALGHRLPQLGHRR